MSHRQTQPAREVGMDKAIGGTLPMAIGVAISPVPITVLLLVLGAKPIGDAIAGF